MKGKINFVLGLEHDHLLWSISGGKVETVWKVNVFDGASNRSTLWRNKEFLDLYLKPSEKKGIKIARSTDLFAAIRQQPRLYKFTTDAHQDISRKVLPGIHIVTHIVPPANYPFGRNDTFQVFGFQNGVYTEYYVPASKFQTWKTSDTSIVFV